jgi:hypothetical protein
MLVLFFSLEKKKVAKVI